MKIASWNINSVRARIESVERLIVEEQPDVLCLQETKALDDVFPAALFKRHGYLDHHLNGQKMHHGVAILSRLPLGEPGRHDWQDNGEARHVGARLPCGIRIENVYVPAGGDIPDRSLNPKFGQKLDFIGRMTKWSEDLREPTLIVGDFNVAPLECDVWSHKALVNVVSHTPIEVEALGALQQAHGWIDIGRKFVPAPERCFTWWSYRSLDYTQNDRGRRLDHMWASPELAGTVTGHRVLEPCRGWQRPSDHVPLICELEV
ncbi:exodeoxyribonuclease III [Sphingomonas sp.]|uniref:exodeoxyribonuclease III n=1 Tax=Sphingomonas sp. TaxID=28214 RepID=UPI00286D6A75|nr:exodeoxyribonuclease III [Sphingomonas sp.]